MTEDLVTLEPLVETIKYQSRAYEIVVDKVDEDDEVEVFVAPVLDGIRASY
jgi:hypothetical protein